MTTIDLDNTELIQIESILVNNLCVCSDNTIKIFLYTRCPANHSSFCVLLIVHLGIILFNDQLVTQFLFVYVYFNSLHVSSIQVLIIRRFNCINTISGICHLHRMTYTRCRIYIIESPDDEHWMFETCRELKYTYTKKNCTSSCSLNRTNFTAVVSSHTN